MGKGSSTPAAPDPVATANAQAASNIATAQNQAQLNEVDQITPYGNLTYEYPTGDVSHAVAVTQLSPSQQSNLNNTETAQGIYGQAAISQLSQAANALSTPITKGSIPALGPNTISASGQVASTPQGQVGTIADPSQFAGQAQGLTQSLQAQLQPQLNQQDAQLTTSLRNQGLEPGSDAWNNAMRQQTQSDTAAQLQTVQAGDTLQQQLYAQALAGQGQQYSQAASNATLNNQALAQQLSMQQTAGNYADQQSQLGLQQATALQTLPINEAAALLTGQQVQQPNFTSVPQTPVAGTDTAGITQNSYADQLSNYQQQVAQQSSALGGIASLAGTGLAAALPALIAL